MPSFRHALFHFLLLLSSVLAYSHPGLLVTNTDVARIKSKLAPRTEPWQASWDQLTSLPYSQSTWTNNAVSRVYRGTYNGAASNAELLWHDVAAAFNLGLRWKIEGNASCAEAASRILGAWGRTLTALDETDDQYLLAGLQGYELLNAAELLRDYPAFESSGNARAFKIMMQNVFVSRNIFFLNHEAPSEHNVKHFHANWELANMASAMAFGIYTDNTTLFDYVIDYFKNGDGNGAINDAFTNLVKEPGTGVTMAQPQEAGRDQGHTALDFQLHGVICQQAWNQGVDLWGYNSSRILQGAEYFARYNLGHDVPFEPWTNNIVSFTTISNASRGSTRPTWELYYAHYVQLKRLQAPWTVQFRNYTLSTIGFETGIGMGEGSGHYDGLGWGSLLHRLDEDVVAPIESSSSGSTYPTSEALSTLAASSTRVVSSTLAAASAPVAPSTLGTSFTHVASFTSTSSTRLFAASTSSPSPSFLSTTPPDRSAVPSPCTLEKVTTVQPPPTMAANPTADTTTISFRRSSLPCSRRQARKGRCRGEAHGYAKF